MPPRTFFGVRAPFVLDGTAPGEDAAEGDEPAAIMATPRRDDGDFDSQLDGERGDVAARSGGEVGGFARDGDAPRWLGGETEAVRICEIIDSSCPRAGELG